tara:strand:- start:4433 stop:4714 length:282 start_codon:yes stop_codon:yes gene_type:complete
MNDKPDINKKFNFLILIFLGLLCWETHSLDKRIKQQTSIYADNQRVVTDLQMMMESFIELAPQEMESIARKTGREESIKVLQEFADNFRKLNE